MKLLSKASNVFKFDGSCAFQRIDWIFEVQSSSIRRPIELKVKISLEFHVTETFQSSRWSSVHEFFEVLGVEGQIETITNSTDSLELQATEIF